MKILAVELEKSSLNEVVAGDQFVVILLSLGLFWPAPPLLSFPLLSLPRALRFVTLTPHFSVPHRLHIFQHVSGAHPHFLRGTPSSCSFFLKDHFMALMPVFHSVRYVTIIWPITGCRLTDFIHCFRCVYWAHSRGNIFWAGTLHYPCLVAVRLVGLRSIQCGCLYTVKHVVNC